MKRNRKGDRNRAAAVQAAAAMRRTKEIASQMLKQAEAKQAATHAALIEAWREYHDLHEGEYMPCDKDGPIMCRGCFELKNLEQ